MAKASLERIKVLTIMALVSDDDLMEKLVLKGGNALRLIHAAPVRQSLDLDFSLDGDLGPVEIARARIELLLVETFLPEELAVFDVKLAQVPVIGTNDVVGEFWGGYTLKFKVLPKQVFDHLASSPQKRGTQAMELGSSGRRAFSVDISKHEYCEGKVECELEGLVVYVYSPLMIACEKVRAICQQMKAYRDIVMSASQRPRARDFFDIHLLVTTCNVRLSSEEAWNTLEKCFSAKRVPLRLMGQISGEREFHRENFVAVRDTVEPTVVLQSFDFYVDFLVEQLAPLKPRWEVDSPRF